MVSKHHFIHLQKVLNMATTKFDIFCVSPDYVMLNSWKDSRHVTDDFSCYQIWLCLYLNDTFGKIWIGWEGPIA